jgi:hypothetical protein
VILRVRPNLPASCVALLGVTIGALTTACTSARPPGVPDPATVSQIKARLLRPGTAPGFVPEPIALSGGSRGQAQPFTPREWSRQVCSDLMNPLLFKPRAALSAGTIIHARRGIGGPLGPPWWFKWIDTTQAPRPRRSPRSCPRWQAAAGTSGGWTRTPRPRIAPCRYTRLCRTLPDLGRVALYLSVRMTSRALPGRSLAFDWVVIRSGHTLIWVADQGTEVAGNGHDPLTLELARDAWHRFSQRSSIPA